MIFHSSGRGHAFLMYNTLHYWLRNTDFVNHRLWAYGRYCFKSCQNLLFHFWCSCISRTSCTAVWDGKQISFSQSSIYSGKDRMTWNTMNWKPLFTQSLCFASILFCFTIFKMHIVGLKAISRHSSLHYHPVRYSCFPTISDCIIVLFSSPIELHSLLALREMMLLCRLSAHLHSVDNLAYEETLFVDNSSYAFR